MNTKSKLQIIKIFIIAAIGGVLHVSYAYSRISTCIHVYFIPSTLLLSPHVYFFFFLVAPTLGSMLRFWSIGLSPRVLLHVNLIGLINFESHLLKSLTEFF
jgi:hypothetical protein